MSWVPLLGGYGGLLGAVEQGGHCGYWERRGDTGLTGMGRQPRDAAMTLPF